MNVEEALLDSSEVLSQRFLMLIQAVSGIRALTSMEIADMEEQELHDRLLCVLMENLDLDRCSIFLREDDRLHCVAGKDWDEFMHQSRQGSKQQSHIFRIGEGIIGKAAAAGRVYHCKNCRQDNDYLPIIHPDSKYNSGSLISAPIMVGRELLGVLNISHPEPNFFHGWQEHIAAIHANILAQMLCSHRLMRKMRQEVEKRTRELQAALHEAETLKNEFRELSLVDELTHLHNRRFFTTEAPRALSHCLRYTEPLSLLLMDLDNFKTINDTYGHDAGDQVLKDVARVLGDETRTGDIVARLGGEEFVFVLPGTGAQGARVFAERLRKKVAGLVWFLDNSEIQVTISIGISDLDGRAGDLQDLVHLLLEEADQALYSCKDKGKNQVVIYAERHVTTPVIP